METREPLSLKIMEKIGNHGEENKSPIIVKESKVIMRKEK